MRPVYFVFEDVYCQDRPLANIIGIVEKVEKAPDSWVVKFGKYKIDWVVTFFIKLYKKIQSVIQLQKFSLA